MIGNDPLVRTQYPPLKNLNLETKYKGIDKELKKDPLSTKWPDDETGRHV